ncbi:hypothetical protein [Candidatus Ichthyocystis hellenicum]|uniref:hypothetical protein n=1 Tax=Candidatus Ichthyocystis hellenicum TaxID=1561003 RepID=UPI000B8083D0|nr:hypothetical protein [Candidatus Ichthyocystis hellenicum]
MSACGSLVPVLDHGDSSYGVVDGVVSDCDSCSVLNDFQSLPVTNNGIYHDHSYPYTVSEDIFLSFSTNYQSLQDIFFFYGCNASFEIIDESLKDNFFQVYANRCNYHLNEVFLSVVNEYKINFAKKVDLILSDLDRGFSFFKDIDSITTVSREFIDQFWICYSKDIHDFVTQSIDILQSDVIPALIKVIFDSKITDNMCCEREMTFYEKEQFFFYFVASLDRLVVVRMICYWRSFFNENSMVLSPRCGGDPFSCLSAHNIIKLPNITYHAALTYEFGAYISCMALAKIRCLTDNFVEKCAISLKNIVRSRCIHICNYSNGVCYDIKELYKELDTLVQEEFRSGVIGEELVANLNSFLKESVILKQRDFRTRDMDISESSVIEVIICDMYNSLMGPVKSELSLIIDRFIPISTMSKGHAFVVLKYVRAVEDNLGFNIHSGMVDSIERKIFSFVRDRFFMLKRTISHECLNVPADGCNDIVKLRSELGNLINMVLKEWMKYDLSDFVKELLLNCQHDIGVEFIDFSISSIVNLVVPDICELLRNYVSNDLCILVENFKSINVRSIKFIPDGKKVLRSAEIRWGLSLHPDDSKFILFISRKFSRKIVDSLCRMFSSMLKSNFVLPSGKVLHKCCWELVSGELYPIIMRSLESIIEDQSVELSKLLSGVRVVDVGSGDVYFYPVREITNDEKVILMTRARISLDKRLMTSIKSSWISVIKGEVNV